MQEKPEAAMRDSLARHLPRTPTDEQQLEAMRRAAWLRQGILVVAVESVTDPWERQTLRNVANRLYDKRREGE